MGSLIGKLSSNRKTLEGKTVLITGASRGLGQQLVIQMAKLGVQKVIILCISEEATKKFIQTLAQQYPHTLAVYFKCDVSNLKDIERVMHSVFKDFQAIDILINNAGRTIGKDALDTLFCEYEQILRVNLLSHVWLTKLILPRMIESGKQCQIVFVSSVLGLFTVPRASAYVTSKHALTGFVRSLQQELTLKGVSNVSVQLVCPGHFDSTMFENAKVKHPRLTPPMKTEKVARVIVEGAILNRQSYVVLPWLLSNTVIMAKFILPGSVYEFVSSKMGVNEFMTSEIGNTVKQPVHTSEINDETRTNVQLGVNNLEIRAKINGETEQSGSDVETTSSVRSENPNDVTEEDSTKMTSLKLNPEDEDKYFNQSSGEESVIYFNENSK